MAKKKTYGVGIIGTGWVAGAHVMNFKKIDATQVVAICSRTKSRADAFVREQGLSDAGTYNKVADFLKHDGLDIVVIATPHPNHPAETIAAARAGKHIVIEKPAALTAGELRKMVAEVNKTKVKTSVCFEVRWCGASQNIKAMLDQNLIGNVHYGHTAYHHGIGPWYAQWEWNRKKQMAGSAELTAGCHAVDLLIWLMNTRVSHVSAMGVKGKRNTLKYNYETVSTVNLQFASGAIGNVSTNIECRQPYLFPILLQGDKGSIWNDKVSTTDWPTTQGWAHVPSAQPDSGDVNDHPYLGQFEYFIDCLQNNRRPHNDLRNAAHAHEVCFAIQQSVRTNKTVKVARTPGT
ncbi:MAG: Gfo/Idh/MocA family oxidoreductase [Phycisphaeraceae bacterium]|jgi:predicted dehydrogenase|nr:Gfo/Idh/MocA family oxidoreductase [Phycisphaeraceae bacterium]MDP7347674.1 Gfo/Idh/MocA family oxidoreductase [Phycisphaeraceae bacterium]